jgi:hypothetical protein
MQKHSEHPPLCFYRTLKGPRALAWLCIALLIVLATTINKASPNGKERSAQSAARRLEDVPRNQTEDNLAFDSVHEAQMRWNSSVTAVLVPGKAYVNVYIHSVLQDDKDGLTVDVLSEELSLLQTSGLWARADHIFLGVLGMRQSIVHTNVLLV